MKILLVDDHSVVRAGMKQVINEAPFMKVTGEAANAQEALAHIYKTDFDVVLMDVAMPGMSGLELMKEIKAIKPDLKVLVLSMYAEELYAVRFFKAGAAGYITKDSPMTEIIEAIRKVGEGRKYVSDSFAKQYLFDLEFDDEKELHEKLSNREYQVLCMIASGKTVTQIAEELALSVKTISTNRTRILKKMNMKNNAELTHYAIKNKLVQ